MWILIVPVLLVVWLFYSRLITWVVSVAIARLFRCKSIAIGKVGLFSVRDVKIYLRNGSSIVSVGIAECQLPSVETALLQLMDRLWVSSSFVNQEFSKPLTICANDVRVELYSTEKRIFPTTHETDKKFPRELDVDKSETKKLRRFVDFMQYVSAHIGNLNFVTMNGLLPGSLLHLSVEQLSLDCFRDRDSFQVELMAKLLNMKVLKRSTNDSSPSPCVMELLVQPRLTVCLDTISYFNKELLLELREPSVQLFEGVEKLAFGTATNRSEEDPPVRASGNSMTTIFTSKLFPQEIRLHLNSSCMKFESSSANLHLTNETKTLSLSCKRFGRPDPEINLEIVNFSIRNGSVPYVHIVSSTVSLATNGEITSLKFVSNGLQLIVIEEFLDQLNWEAIMKLKRNGAGGRPNAEGPVKSKLLNFSIGFDKTSILLHPKYLSTHQLCLTSPYFSVERSHETSGDVITEVAFEQLSFGALIKGKESTIHMFNMQNPLDSHEFGSLIWVEGFLMHIVKTSSKIAVQVQSHNFAVEVGLCGVTFCKFLDDRLLSRLPVQSSAGTAPSTADQTRWTLAMTITNLAVFLPYQQDSEAFQSALLCTAVTLERLRVDRNPSIIGVTGSSAKIIFLDCAKRKRISVGKATDDTISCFVPLVKTVFDVGKRSLSVKVDESLKAVYHQKLHMTMWSWLKQLKILSAVSSRLSGKNSAKTTSSAPLTVSITFVKPVELLVKMTTGKRVAFTSPSLKLDWTQQGFYSETANLAVIFDSHTIVHSTDLSIRTTPLDGEADEARRYFPALTTRSNRMLYFTATQLAFDFPYEYDFGDAFEELLNLKKWIKQVHNLSSAPFKEGDRLPRDWTVAIDDLVMSMEDDEFEVKLRRNHLLMLDECYESERRQQLLEAKLDEMRTANYMLLTSSRVEELQNSLRKKDAEIYVCRSKKLSDPAPESPSLFTWRCKGVKLLVLADDSFHGKENVIKQIRQMDSDSPMPPMDEMEFSTLWCRIVDLQYLEWDMKFRDYPQSYFLIKEGRIWGKVAVAEIEGSDRAKRSSLIDLGSPFGQFRVDRNMPPMKFFYDFNMESETFSTAYGPCWEPCLSMISLCFDYINKPSLDPSPPLPVWDKIRLLWHGRIIMASRKLTIIMLASADPYNAAEQMEWVWQEFVMDWHNGYLRLEGDLDANVRTASKYDDCRLIHWPGLRVRVKMKWFCLGDPNDHHSVMPCSPDKVPEYSVNQIHDSYRSFRSQYLNLEMTYEIGVVNPAEAAEPSNCPQVLLYANTLRWIDGLKTTLSAVNRPIKRGVLFHNTKMRKPQLSRHYKRIYLTLSVPKFVVSFWMSFSSGYGFRLVAQSLHLGSAHQLSNVQSTKDSDKKPQGEWSTVYMNAELNKVDVCLMSVVGETLEQQRVIDSPDYSKKHFFLSLSRLAYAREAVNIPAKLPSPGVPSSSAQVPMEDVPKHSLILHDLKGAWTSANRDAVLAILDGFQKAKLLKRNLSTEALKGLKIGANGGGKKLSVRQTHPTNLTTTNSQDSSASGSEAGRMAAFLQKLIDESTTKFYAYSEESQEVPTKQLQGVLICQTDDVLFRNWRIELINGQVLLRGCQTGGYVLCSATGAKIIESYHRPTWRDNQLLSKSTWTGSISGMQYYATVASQRHQSPFDMQDDVQWLTNDLIQEQNAEESTNVVDKLLNAGDSVGGVIQDVSAEKAGVAPDQLQRIISRCGCQFYFCHFYENLDEELNEEVPPLPVSSEEKLWQEKEDVDCFTLKHTTLNCCTNHLQYAMILDMVNNLLLYVDPKKKESAEKLKRLRFQLKLQSVDDLRPHILNQQNQVRLMLANLKHLERQVYHLGKQSVKDQSDTQSLARSDELEREVELCKAELVGKSEDLAMTISCFKEKQVQKEKQQSQPKLTSEQQAQIARRFEVCFEEAQWRLTEPDGQLGVADIKITNFLYTKISRTNNSGEHLIELGYVKISNLLPSSPYRDVLQPQYLTGLVSTDRHCAFRMLCREMPPVGGISVKELFEVNVAPMTIQITYAFYRALMKYFFPDKNIESEDQQNLDTDDQMPSTSSVKKSSSKAKTTKKRHSVLDDDIEKMKNRADKNNVFLNIKIPEVPFVVSYKGEKEKNIADVENFHLLFPMVEYHDRNWTWLDVSLAIKQRAKRVLVQQFMKQKILKTKKVNTSDAESLVNLPEEEKARLLFGKLLGGPHKLEKKVSANKFS